ncbi:glycosyltransferase family 2 protein [Marinicella rhabdoformis]|uniref:glycosyltransferase family 2 protein n=1 Tax=Marinicella rhabdoformis TaxID=2580566 RepID=UPI0012AED60F|nr:glycosyltransferase family 2 protein [Marinicella rhabdoformis]
MNQISDQSIVPVSVDVVIVNYNAGQYVIDLINVLKHNKQMNVIVVDNASSDGSLKRLQQLDVNLLENDKNMGFSYACNQGAQCGSSPVISFVNPDCLLEQGQLEQLTQRITKGSSDLLGCHVVDPDGSTQKGTWRRLPNIWRVLKTVSSLEKLPFIQGLNLRKAPVNVEAVNGACYAIKRPVFEEISGFDEGYPLHFEDLDLFKRIQDKGGKLGYAGDIQVKHIKGHSSTDSKQVVEWKKQGLLRYFEKHRPNWEQKLIHLLVGLK